MLVITIAHQKGGVGKTTLTLNLAYCLAETLRVAIADTDPQGSVSDLEGLLTGVGIIGLSQVLEGKTTDYDVVIIDTPPYLSSRLTDLFAISDYVLIPTKAGFLDAMAIKATVNLLRESMAKRPGLKAGIVLSMVLSHTTLNDEIKEMLLGYDLPIHQTMITQRVSYTRSPITNSVFGSTDEKAKAEIVNLAMEIMETLEA